MTSRHDGWLDTHEQSSLFAKCSRCELRLVSAVTTQLVLPPGTVLAHENARPSAFVIVLDGTAEARRDGQHVEAISPGKHFGEIALVRGICEPATVIAQTRVTVSVVGSREFRTLYAVLGSFRDRIDRELDERVPSWLTPRSTGIADTAQPARASTTRQGALPRKRLMKPRTHLDRDRRSVATCPCGRRTR